MKTYYVSIPLAGSIEVRVEAATEEDAITKAWEMADYTISSSNEDIEIGESDLFSKIIEGNVCYAPLWEITVETE